MNDEYIPTKLTWHKFDVEDLPPPDVNLLIHNPEKGIQVGYFVPNHMRNGYPVKQCWWVASHSNRTGGYTIEPHNRHKWAIMEGLTLE